MECRVPGSHAKTCIRLQKTGPTMGGDQESRMTQAEPSTQLRSRAHRRQAARAAPGLKRLGRGRVTRAGGKLLHTCSPEGTPVGLLGTFRPSGVKSRPPPNPGSGHHPSDHAGDTVTSQGGEGGRKGLEEP